MLTNFSGVNNIGLEKLHKKSVDNKVQSQVIALHHHHHDLFTKIKQ